MPPPTGPAGFTRQAAGTNTDLRCDGVPLTSIAAAVGTPVYVYSAPVLRERYRAIDAAFGDYPHAASIARYRSRSTGAL